MPKVDAHDLIPYAPSGGRPENESSFATTKSPAAVATRAATETTEDNTALKVCTHTVRKSRNITRQNRYPIF